MSSARRTDLDRLCSDLDSLEHVPEHRSRDWKPFSAVLKEIRFHARYRYWHFTPTYTEEFEERLRFWLGNSGLKQKDQGALLRLVPEIQFVDRDDLLALYRSAFMGPIRRWIFDQNGLSFGQSEATRARLLQRGLKSTWFCPLTDSMDIGQFLHVNKVPGEDQRPSWRVLTQFSTPQRIQDYCNKRGYKRIVILEDFVGSGTQAKGPLEFAGKRIAQSIPVLFVPLIASEAGVERLRNLAAKYRRAGDCRLEIETVFVVPRQAQICAVADQVPGILDSPLWNDVRDLVTRTFPNVRQPPPPEKTPLKEPFGFGGLGMLLVLYTNCPNNTLPLVWHSNSTWRSLFPRVSRH